MAIAKLNLGRALGTLALMGIVAWNVSLVVRIAMI